MSDNNFLEQPVENYSCEQPDVEDTFQIPAMPLGEGIYYQPGAFHAYGTFYVDSQDRPLLINSAGMDGMSEVCDLREWFDAYREGDEALVALEAGRQQRRLAETSFAHCFRLSDVCPGGKILGSCAVGSAAYREAEDWAEMNSQEDLRDGTLSTALAWVGGQCLECALKCEVSVKTVNGKREETRVTFSRLDQESAFMRAGNSANL